MCGTMHNVIIGLCSSLEMTLCVWACATCVAILVLSLSCSSQSSFPCRKWLCSMIHCFCFSRMIALNSWSCGSHSVYHACLWHHEEHSIAAKLRITFASPSCNIIGWQACKSGSSIGWTASLGGLQCVWSTSIASLHSCVSVRSSRSSLFGFFDSGSMHERCERLRNKNK